MHILSRAAFIVAALCAAPLRAEQLTLEDALLRALDSTPQVEADAARLDALRAARRQAGVGPNPSIEFYGENFAGTGPYRYFDQPEVSVTYSQVIERGGKPEARVALAESEISVAEAEAIVERLDFVQRVQTSWVAAVAAEARIEIAAERLQLAKSLAAEITRRVSAARDPLFAGTLAQTRVTEAEVNLELAEQAGKNALKRLLSFWEASSSNFSLPVGEFFRFERPGIPVMEPPPADLAILEARARRAEAEIDFEQARRVQDPTLRGGLRYLRGTDDIAFIFGVSIPLAFNDTNRNNVERALAERRRAEAHIEVARQQRLRELRLAEERVHEARREAEAIRDRIIPGARKALEQAREGYARGAFSHIEVADAERALADIRMRYVQAAVEYHMAGVILDRLTARFAQLVSTMEAY